MPSKSKPATTFQVSKSKARAEARKKEKLEAPLQQTATNFNVGAAFPALYGVDMKERKRQVVLRDITKKK